MSTATEGSEHKSRNIPLWAIITGIILCLALEVGLVVGLTRGGEEGDDDAAPTISETAAATPEDGKIEFEEEDGRIKPVEPVFLGDESLGPLAPKYININGEKAAIRAVYPETSDPTGETGWTFNAPTDVSEIAWLGGQRGSSYPGDGQGTVMMTGHIDMQGQGTGYANLFLGLKEGDEVEITNNADVTRVYKVKEAPTVITKAEENSENSQRVFERASRADGPEELVLITCSGTVVENNGVFEYDQNTFVFLDPESVRYDGEGEEPEHLMYLTR